MKKLIALIALIGALALGPASVIAAGNPAGTGNPGTPTVSCGNVTTSPVTGMPLDSTLQPAGLTTPGFLFATTRYNPNSQYDIACYQFTSSHS